MVEAGHFFISDRASSWICRAKGLPLPVKIKNMEKDNAYLDRFERKLEEDLLRLCTSYKQLDGTLLAAEDIDNHWNVLAPEYLADAVEQVRDYPVVSVAWAAYLGMAVAWGWDADWATVAKAPYRLYYGEQGFDDMDEHIVKDFLGLALDSEEARVLEESIRRCAQNTVSLIRHEQIEPQSPMAYHVFARACRVMYRIGAALELKRMGYKLEKIQLD